MGCSCEIGPGKFEGESALTYLLWQHVMTGGGDYTTGGDEVGSPAVDWFRAPLAFDADAISSVLDIGYCQECVKKAGKGVGGGAAVWEDSQGFVNSITYPTQEEFERALNQAEAADEEAAEEEEEEDEADEADEGEEL